MGRLARRVIAATLVALVAAGGLVAWHRSGQRPVDRGSGSAGTVPRAGHGGRPVRAVTVRPTGRGRGYARVIPCYTVTRGELGTVLHAHMQPLGQRAAGSGGFELHGFARETCYWFGEGPDGTVAATGPWVEIGSLTTSELHGRGLSGWTARRFFLDAHRHDRTALPDIGDAAYAFGPASAAVLVGDVYLDVRVVASDGHPAADARRIVALLGRLQVSGP